MVRARRLWCMPTRAAVDSVPLASPSRMQRGIGRRKPLAGLTLSSSFLPSAGYGEIWRLARRVGYDGVAASPSIRARHDGADAAETGGRRLRGSRSRHGRRDGNANIGSGKGPSEFRLEMGLSIVVTVVVYFASGLVIGGGQHCGESEAQSASDTWVVIVGTSRYWANYRLGLPIAPRNAVCAGTQQTRWQWAA